MPNNTLGYIYIGYIVCDGKCLYTACATLLCGKDEPLGVLRDLTSTKLFIIRGFLPFIYKRKMLIFSNGKIPLSCFYIVFV